MNIVMMKRKYSIILFFVTVLCSNAQSFDPLECADAQMQKKWVDSLYNSLSLEQRVGQLFMISVFSKEKDFSKVEQSIKKEKIGGIIFSKGTPKRQLMLTERFQSVTKVPLLIAMDAEWGLSMRLDSTFAYPWNMTLGAVKDNQLIEQVAGQIAKHCKALGVHIDFAPDVDVNTNFKNPIIGNRSFGEDVENVSEKGKAFIRGMQQQGVLSSAKHFPGHGDTSQDSHKTLPTLNHSKERLQNIEMKPFTACISEGVASIMVGHLNVPALEEKSDCPSSLSRAIVTDILKEKLSYKGLIFTDALQMKGVSSYKPDADVALEAFLAGNDLLLMPENTSNSVKSIIKAYRQGVISEERLAYSVKKILKAKYLAGLNRKKQSYNWEEIQPKIHTFEDDKLLEQIAENALTLIKNQDSILPFKQVQTPELAYVSLGNSHHQAFYQSMRLYADIPHLEASTTDELLKKASPYKTIVVGLHKSDKTPWDSFKISEQDRSTLQKLATQNKVVLVVFASPYALKDVDLSKISSVVVAYQNKDVFQNKASQLLFGAISAKGVLPVSISEEFPVNTSLSTPLIGRIAFGLPDTYEQFCGLSKIDSLMQKAIQERMTPGGQVVVSKKGKIIYRKSYGTLDYNPNHLVTDTTLYDLASLTKILSTLPQMMYLFDNQYYSLDDNLGSLLPQLRETNKSPLKIRNMLAHYAGFLAWIPFYKETLDDKGYPSNVIYSSQLLQAFPYQVAENLYIRKDYPDEMFYQIAQSPLLKKKQYLYSDLPFYLLQKYIEQTVQTSLMSAVESRFYLPMGLYRMRYLPLRFFSKEEIAPTEEDNYFRHQKLQGHVHDMGAAMLGGVAGHAGLFADATSVAQMMQMFLQGGHYGGHQYITQSTIDTFNTCAFCKNKVRRGLGFDKPQIEEEGPTCGCVPMSSFGHTGFTGTYAWADPENEIVYVFLSNRTYPTAENKKLIQQNIRTKIQQIIYQSLTDKK